MSELGAQLTICPIDNGWALSGEVDAHTAPALEAALAELPAGMEISLDVAGVSFMDSSGLRVLMDTTTRARELGGDLIITNPTSTIERLVRIAGLSGHLRLDPT